MNRKMKVLFFLHLVMEWVLLFAAQTRLDSAMNDDFEEAEEI